MNIFVGNLLFEATEGDVKKLFEGFGNVASVVIVMQKGKKTPKSRGFGFVQMPDEQQAFAAIGALNGKEFMGRVLNVNPARPIKERSNPTGVGLPMRPYGQPGTYRGGRRTLSYMKRRGLAGMQEEVKPRQRSQDNPMRWRKKKYGPRPWQKSRGEHKPWEKSPGEHKPWEKSPGEHKPWKKTEGEARPWKKAEGEFKPWRKSEGGIKPWKKPAGDAKPWKKPAGDAKPWKKPAGDAKPWKKPAGDAKPWRKSSERPQKSRFKGRRKPGGH